LSLKLAAASAVAGLLVLAGCKVDQKKEVAQYRTLLDASSPGRPDYDGRRPLTLAEALATANADNERLGISGEDYVQSLINKNRALAGFLPTVSFQPSYTLQQTARVGSANTTSAVSNPVGGGGTGTGNGTGSGVVTPVAASTSIPTFRPLTHEVSQSFQAPVVGGINLFRGGYDIANLKAAEATILQRRELLFDTQEAVLINVAQAYYAVLRAEQSADVLRQTLTRLTFDADVDLSPVWTPDGRRIVFASTRSGVYNLYAREVDGAASDMRLTSGANTQLPDSVTPDGAFVIGHEVRPQTRSDLVRFPLDPGRHAGAPAAEGLVRLAVVTRHLVPQRGGQQSEHTGHDQAPRARWPIRRGRAARRRSAARSTRAATTIASSRSVHTSATRNSTVG